MSANSPAHEVSSMKNTDSVPHTLSNVKSNSTAIDKIPFSNNGTHANGQANNIPGLTELIEASKPKPLFSRWSLRTLKDAYRERPPVEYVVDKLFPVASLSIIYGAPGSMKSMILADLAVCVASGARWLEPLPVSGNSAASFATRKYPVLWIDYDNGMRRTDERFEAFGKARGLSDDAPIHYVSMAYPWLKADDDALINELIEEINNSGIKLVIIDNLGLISGDADENSADMAPVMGNLRRLAELSGAAVVVIHHQRKGASADRSGDLLRGHSSIEAALDLALLVSRKDQESTITIKPTKVRGASVTSEFCADFTYQHRPGTHDLESARYWGATPTSEKDDMKNLVVSSTLIVLKRCAASGEKPNKGDLVKLVMGYIEAEAGTKPPGTNAVRGYVDGMVADGTITISDKGTAGKFYGLSH